MLLHLQVSALMQSEFMRLSMYNSMLNLQMAARVISRMRVASDQPEHAASNGRSV